MDADTLTILLVNAGGQTFGIPVVQVERLETQLAHTACFAKEPMGVECLSLATALGCATFGELAYILCTKNETGWAVEAIGELVSVPPASLRRLPALLAGHTARAIWGALWRENDWIWLIDLERLG